MGPSDDSGYLPPKPLGPGLNYRKDHEGIKYVNDLYFFVKNYYADRVDKWNELKDWIASYEILDEAKQVIKEMNEKNQLKRENVMDEGEWIEFCRIIKPKIIKIDVPEIDEMRIKEFYYVFNQATL